MLGRWLHWLSNNPGWVVLLVLAASVSAHWFINWPPSSDRAVRIEGLVISHALLGNKGIRVDSLTIAATDGAKKIRIRAENAPDLGTVSQKHIVALVDRRDWILSLDVEGKTRVAYSETSAAYKRTFWVSAFFCGFFVLVVLTLWVGGYFHEMHRARTR
jgi:hypothetical protein